MGALSKTSGIAIAAGLLVVLTVVAVISAGAAFGWYDDEEPHSVDAMGQNGRVSKWISL